MCPDALNIEYLLLSVGIGLIFLTATSLVCATAFVPSAPLITVVTAVFETITISSSMIKKSPLLKLPLLARFIPVDVEVISLLSLVV